MWVTTRVSPSTTRSSSSKRPPRSFLAPLASSARIFPREQPARTSRSTCRSRFLSLRLSHRDPGVTVERHPAAPLAGMGKSIPSCQGEINRVFQPPPELRQGGIPSRGRKQGCFQPWPPDSATMRQARRSSSAMLAKYTAWVTAPGRRAGENEVKRTAGGQGRKAAAQPAVADVPPQPADRRRTGLRAPVPPARNRSSWANR